MFSCESALNLTTKVEKAAIAAELAGPFFRLGRTCILETDLRGWVGRSDRAISHTTLFDARTAKLVQCLPGSFAEDNVGFPIDRQEVGSKRTGLVGRVG